MPEHENGKRLWPHPTVLMVRHGTTDFNRGPGGGRFKGTEFDLPLNAEGRAEAKADAKALAGWAIAGVESSPMIRATQTAAAICHAVGCKPDTDEALRPWDIGYLAGHKKDEARARVEYYITHCRKEVPGGESYHDWWEMFTDNLSHELAEAAKSDHRHNGGWCADVLATHSCDLLAAKSFLTGGDPQVHTEGNGPEPGRITVLSRIGGKWRWRGDLNPSSGGN